MESPEVITFSDDFDSACSTPFVSAPSSPGRNPHPTGFFYSAPASPIHYMISSSSSKTKGSVTSPDQPSGPFEFEFTRKQAQTLATASMTSADELFFNGQIRPMKLSSHLQRPQVLSPLLDIHNENENENENDDEDDDVTEEPVRGRDYRSKSLRRRARSMSPLRTCEWLEEFEQDTKQNLEQQEDNSSNNNNNNNTMNKVKLAEMETTPSGASSRSSSLGRSSKRWVFLKEFLYRSKSEGRTSTSTSSSNNNNTNNIKFWTSLSFSPNKDKKLSDNEVKGKGKVPGDGNGNVGAKKAVNGVSNRRLGRSARSAHEVHYTLNRAQSEEMRRKTYLPYKQGLLGCLGFSSKSYGAMNGFARALNPVSSR